MLFIQTYDLSTNKQEIEFVESHDSKKKKKVAESTESVLSSKSGSSS